MHKLNVNSLSVFVLQVVAYVNYMPPPMTPEGEYIPVSTSRPLPLILRGATVVPPTGEYRPQGSFKQQLYAYNSEP